MVPHKQRLFLALGLAISGTKRRAVQDFPGNNPSTWRKTVPGTGRVGSRRGGRNPGVKGGRPRCRADWVAKRAAYNRNGSVGLAQIGDEPFRWSNKK